MHRHCSGLLIATAMLMAGCAGSDKGPVPADCSLQRELRFALPVPAPTGDTATVVREEYGPPAVAATARRSADGLEMTFTAGPRAETMRLFVPAASLSPGLVGEYPCQPYLVGQPMATAANFYWGADFNNALVISTNYYMADSTGHRTIGRGTIRIEQYDARQRLLRGSYTAQQAQAPTPAEWTRYGRSCTVAVSGSFANLQVQE